MRRIALALIPAVLLLAGPLTTSAATEADTALQAAIAGSHRSAEHVARDGARHPYETLQFFGIRPDMTVVEISPGGGWYTEILAPYLKDRGTLYAAHFDPASEIRYQRDGRARFDAKLAAAPALYGAVKVSVFDPAGAVEIAPSGSADLVLTFRNVHNWYMGGGAANLESAFATMFRALKPGGVLGVVDHRLPAGRDPADQKASGYMLESVVIEAARRVGFTLAARSQINANPRDTADHPGGVWNLPPTLRGDAARHDHYRAIGESDRMTLKFVKPAP